jgi:hypothetical protein
MRKEGFGGLVSLSEALECHRERYFWGRRYGATGIDSD